MKIVGIICEYNPFHLGHAKQIRLIREYFGEDCAIVCLMSGNFVQRGEPAVFHKSLRARAAVDCGADLVLEMPVQYALSSAEGFAAGGVSILGSFCDYLCFGCETGEASVLMATAKALLSPEIQPIIREKLLCGISYPAARAEALEALGLDAALLRRPNDILAVEYCKAILSQGSKMRPLPIRRRGDYHDNTPDPENPSATALRRLIAAGEDFRAYVPREAADIFAGAPVYTLSTGSRAVMARLRTMTEAEFEALPYGSEGLWRKFMHGCRRESTPEAIAASAKSKRYTATRLQRMLMCAYLGIDRNTLESPAPYARVLAFSSAGQQVLRMAREHTALVNIGQRTHSPYEELEHRCGDLYDLFRSGGPTEGGSEARLRVYVRKKVPEESSHET